MAVDPAGLLGAAERAGQEVAARIVLAQADAEVVTDGVSDGAAEQSAFPPFDATLFASHLFWLAIAFGILYFAMVRLIVPQVGGILEDRRDRIAGDLGEANRLKRETDEVIATYERELAEARAKAHAIAQERREAVKREIAEEQATTERQLQERIAEAERTIAAMRDQALAEVGDIATAAATEIIAKVSPVDVAETDVSAAVASRRAA